MPSHYLYPPHLNGFSSLTVEFFFDLQQMGFKASFIGLTQIRKEEEVKKEVVGTI